CCISRHYRAGVDLERIQSRRPEFYVRTFHPEERSWVEQISEQAGVQPDAVFTLSWSVKEAYLKTSSRADLSVWSFPQWPVWFDGPVDRVLRPQQGDQLVRVPGGIRSGGFSHSFDIAAMRVDEMILATVQYREAHGLAANVRSE